MRNHNQWYITRWSEVHLRQATNSLLCTTATERWWEKGYKVLELPTRDAPTYILCESNYLSYSHPAVTCFIPAQLFWAFLEPSIITQSVPWLLVRHMCTREPGPSTIHFFPIRPDEYRDTWPLVSLQGNQVPKPVSIGTSQRFSSIRVLKTYCWLAQTF